MPSRPTGALLALAAAACMTRGDGRALEKAMQSRHEELLREVRAASRAAETRLRRLEEHVAESHRDRLERGAQVRQIQEEASRLTGRLDALERDIDVQRRELQLLRDTAPAARPVPAGPAPPDLGDPEAAYFAAVKEFAHGRFQKAIDLFLAALERYPKHPRAEAIQYGIAEAYLAKKDHRQALVELKRFYIDHGTSPRAPEALLRMAECFHATGDRRRAVAALRLVRKKYKDSPIAKEAAKMLSDITAR